MRDHCRAQSEPRHCPAPAGSHCGKQTESQAGECRKSRVPHAEHDGADKEHPDKPGAAGFLSGADDVENILGQSEPQTNRPPQYHA